VRSQGARRRLRTIARQRFDDSIEMERGKFASVCYDDDLSLPVKEKGIN